MKKNIIEYDLLRVIVTLLVILGHCTYYKIEEPNNYNHYILLASGGLSNFYKFAKIITTIIYLFHMPLYMALSGALLKYKENTTGGYTSYKSLVGDKAKKLLFPFITVLILYAVPIKYVSGFYSKSDNIFMDILVDEVFIQKGFYLWFLPTLFCIFLVNYTLEKHSSIKTRYKLAAMFVLSCIYNIFPLNILNLIAKHIFWFYLGYCFEDYRERFNNRINNKYKYLLVFGIFFVIFCLIYASIESTEKFNIYFVIKKILGQLCAAFGCSCVYCLSFYLSKTKLVETKIFKLLRKNTFGMYLYSDPWNYVVLAVSVQLLGAAVFTTDLGSAIMYFSRIIITGGVSLAISMILKKFKVKYIC